MKNGFVVTWLTIVNLWLWLTPKIEAALLPLLLVVAEDDATLELLLLLEPQASSANATMPAAPPVSAVRRVT